jgi:hypothetical protein
METSLIAIVLVIVLALSLVVFFVAKNRGLDSIRTDYYRTFFIIGVAFIPIGIATENFTFTILGLVFLILGATNKDKWLDNRARDV